MNKHVHARCGVSHQLPSQSRHTFFSTGRSRSVQLSLIGGPLSVGSLRLPVYLRVRAALAIAAAPDRRPSRRACETATMGETNLPQPGEFGWASRAHLPLTYHHRGRLVGVVRELRERCMQANRGVLFDTFFDLAPSTPPSTLPPPLDIRSTTPIKKRHTPPKVGASLGARAC